MLGTDIALYIMKRTKPAVAARLQTVAPLDVCISVISAAELRYGVAVSPHPERDGGALTRLLRAVHVAELAANCVEDYASIRAHLKRVGTPIGANDFWIAAHARSLGLTLVTNNTREFGRVPDLMLENWVSGA